MMELSGSVQCPVCNKHFASSVVTVHVNRCLSQSEPDVQVTEGDDNDKSAPQKQKKRKSSESDTDFVTAWGSLRPAASSNIAGKTKVVVKKAKPESETKPTVRKGFQEQAHKPVIEIDLNEDSDQEEIPQRSATSGTNTPKLSNPGTTVLFKDDGQCTSKLTCNSATPNESLKSVTHSSKLSSTFKQIPSRNLEYGPNGRSSKQQTTDHGRFHRKGKLSNKPCAPLAEQVRPVDFGDYVGQEQAVGRKSLLRTLLRNDEIPSMILWGPPGCGKTTLARIIAHRCKAGGGAKFVQLSAASSGVNDVKEVIKVAKNDQKMFKKKTVLFLDEIHRFNKSQQDTLLPHVEDGTLTLIGATTENPSFQVNTALLSRCRVIVLEKLAADHIEKILLRAADRIEATVIDSQTELEKLDKSAGQHVFIERAAIQTLSHLCDGDARVALNGLQMTYQAVMSESSQSERPLLDNLKNHTRNSSDFNGETNPFDEQGDTQSSSSEKHRYLSTVTRHPAIITVEQVKEGLQRSHVLYDRTGEEHYNIISALHKSIRGSDANATLYWLARMLEGGEDPLYIARRLVRAASEDIGLADPLALNQAVAAYQACHFIGMPECQVILAQCAVYLARAAKSVEVYQAYENAQKCVRNHEGPLPSVPLHLRNAPTKLMKSLGYGKGYKYNPNFKKPVDQQYLPDCLQGVDFFT